MRKNFGQKVVGGSELQSRFRRRVSSWLSKKCHLFFCSLMCDHVNVFECLLVHECIIHMQGLNGADNFQFTCPVDLIYDRFEVHEIGLENNNRKATDCDMICARKIAVFFKDRLFASLS